MEQDARWWTKLWTEYVGVGHLKPTPAATPHERWPLVDESYSLLGTVISYLTNFQINDADLSDRLSWICPKVLSSGKKANHFVIVVSFQNGEQQRRAIVHPGRPGDRDRR